MKNLGKVMKTSTSEGNPWKQELNKFLRNYRATPHISTNIAPSTALFGRNLKIKLPAVSVSKNDDQLMRSADTKSKERRFQIDPQTTVTSIETQVTTTPMNIHVNIINPFNPIHLTQNYPFDRVASADDLAT